MALMDMVREMSVWVKKDTQRNIHSSVWEPWSSNISKSGGMSVGGLESLDNLEFKLVNNSLICGICCWM